MIPERVDNNIRRNEMLTLTKTKIPSVLRRRTLVLDGDFKYTNRSQLFQVSNCKDNQVNISTCRFSVIN